MKLNLMIVACLAMVGCGSSDEPKSEFGKPCPVRPKVEGPSSPPLVLVIPSPSDAGVDSSTNGSDASVDAEVDAGWEPPVCESGSVVVGHCLFNMATACEEFFSDQEVECGKHPMGGHWWPGPCGGERETDLARSSGGCMNACGGMYWHYPLGGGPPTDQTRADVQEMCVGRNQTYVSAESQSDTSTSY